MAAPARAGYEDAAAYNVKAEGIAMLVMHKGKIVFENYTQNGGRDKPVELASGTKSFNAAIAAAAVQDGFLNLDEKASDTITEWKNDPQKSTITIRQILSLTSGLKARSPMNRPTYAEAVNLPLETKPGQAFEYSPSNFQLFGEIMTRKLRHFQNGKYKDPLAYLQARILTPLDIHPKNWDKDDDGNPILSMGADITAREWARYGQFVLQGGQWNGRQLVSRATLAETLKGSQANRAYGLSWWLNQYPGKDAVKASRTMTVASDLFTNPAARALPANLFMAAGAGKQRLYIIPSQDLVIVRLTRGIFDRPSLRERWQSRRKDGPAEKFSDTDFLSKALAH